MKKHAYYLYVELKLCFLFCYDISYNIDKRELEEREL